MNGKITSNKPKHLAVENELKKLKTFDSIYFISKNHFEENGSQNYLAFQSLYRYFKWTAGVANGSYFYCWQSKGLSDERINYIRTPNYSITFNHKKGVNIYIVYEINKSINISDYPTLENC